MEASNLIEGEKVQIVNVTNGERLETYVIKGEIILNGAAARKVAKGDIIIFSYAVMDFEKAKKFNPSVVFPDELTNTLVG